MLFVTRPYYVRAFQFDSTNADQVQKRCARRGVLCQMPGNPSLSPMARHIAIMTARGTWDYLGDGDWFAEDATGCFVLKPDQMAAFVTPAEARKTKPHHALVEG